MTKSMDQIILDIEENIKQFRLKKIDANGDFYDDNDEDFNFDEDEDLVEDGLCRNELM